MVFYGWWMVTTSVIISFPCALIFGAFSAFIDPIQATFAATTTMTVVAFTLLRAESGFAVPLVAFLIDTYGSKAIIFIGGILIGLGSILAGLAPSLLVFYLGFIILSAGFSFGNPVIMSIAIAPWFKKYRGRAFAISTCGIPIWSICIPLMVIAIDMLGWRTALIGLGIASMIVMLPGSLVFRRQPSDFGLYPDGAASESLQSNVISTSASITVKEVLRFSGFWWLSVCFAAFAFVHTGLAAQWIPLVEDLAGVNRQSAAMIATAIPVISLIGRLGIGIASDYISARYVFGFALFLMCLGLSSLAFINSLSGAIGLVVLYGIGYGGFAPLRYSLQGWMFGPNKFGRIQGMLRLVDTFVGIPAPILLAFLKDIRGDYVISVYICAALVAMTVPIAVRLQRVPTDNQE